MYNLLIYASEQIFAAMNVTQTSSEYISMDGNTDCRSDNVAEFYENLLDFYNVDDLSEMEISVQIINAGISEKNLRYLNDRFAKLGEYDIWSIQKLIPIILLELNGIEKNGNLVVKIYDKSYQVQTDDQFFFTVEPSDNTPTMLFTLEHFTILNHFDGKHFHGDEEEMKHLKDRLEETTKEYEQKLLDSETQYNDLWTKYNRISLTYDLLKIEEMRMAHEYQGIHVIRFDSNLMEGERKNDGTEYSYRIHTGFMNYGKGIKDVYSKNEKILTFDEFSRSNTNNKQRTGRSYTLKAGYKGTLIRLKSENDDIKDGDVVAIVIDEKSNA